MRKYLRAATLVAAVFCIPQAGRAQTGWVTGPTADALTAQIGGVGQATIDANGYTGVISAASAVASGANTARTMSSRFADTLNVQDYGAKQDGVTDDAAAINSAIAAAAAKGGAAVVIYNTGKAVMVDSPIVPVTGTELMCVGDPVIMLKAGANTAVIESQNFQTLIGGTSSDGAHNVYIHGCTIDGNSTNQTAGANPDFQNGISLYGAHEKVEWNVVRNVYGNGIRTGGSVARAQALSVGYESTYDNNWVLTAGARGYWFQGPSDGFYTDLYAVDASQLADNTYCGFQFDTSSNAMHIHGWHAATATNRVAYQACLNGGVKMSMSDLEGGRRQVKLTSGNNVSQLSIYASFATTEGTCMFDISGSDNIVANSRFTHNVSTAGNNSYAICLGTTTANVLNNQIYGNEFLGYNVYTPFNFFASSGLNVVQGHGYSSSGGAVTFGGAVNANDVIDYEQGGTVISFHQHPYTVASVSATALTATTANLTTLHATTTNFTKFPQAFGVTGQFFGPYAPNMGVMEENGTQTRFLHLGADTTTTAGSYWWGFAPSNEATTNFPMSLSFDGTTATFNVTGNLQSNGRALYPVLTATTGSIGGTSLANATCATGTVSVSGATTAMAVIATPAGSDPGNGFSVGGYVSASGTVTVKVCNLSGLAAAPVAVAYNVRVIQ
ncbi:MAG: glycosyl hydrolase family 28-related protein [Azospirillaceae bacterium]|nr:glycosyl hydrolase family 28-related protein [Azospirillaceae bacterium]